MHIGRCYLLALISGGPETPTWNGSVWTSSQEARQRENWWHVSIVTCLS